VTSASNKLYIANSTTDPPLIYGDFSSTRVGLGTVSPAEKLEVNGSLIFTGNSTLYPGTGTNLTINAGGGTGFLPDSHLPLHTLSPGTPMLGL